MSSAASAPALDPHAGDPPSLRSAPAHRRNWLLPLAASVAILTWQSTFLSSPAEPRRPYAMRASQGMVGDVFLFFYYFHHYGLFPVGAREVPELGPSKQAAAEFVAHHGDRLTMDFGGPTNLPRFGDYGKLLLFYPDLWMRHDPAHPSALPANVLLFMAALLAVWWSFWREGHALLGAAIVVLVGSDPFQLFEAYGRNNVFSLPVSVALLALAAHVGFLTGRGSHGPRAWIVAIGSGVALASFREVRSEVSAIAVSVVAVYLLARGSWARRLLLTAAFALAFAITGLAWGRYWRAEFARAERFVQRAGGDVFRAPQGSHHAFWHAVWCGLGDYGGDRGFVWDDRAAFRWATTYDPATNPHPIPYHYSSGWYLDETFDGVHHVAPTDLPQYNQLVRSRALGEIRRDPLWYGRILFARVVAIQRHAVPAALAWGATTLTLPGAGWVTIPVLVFALLRRRFLHAALILFVLPLSAAPLIVYSGRGMTFYGIQHLIALAVALDLLVRMRRPRPALEAPRAA